MREFVEYLADKPQIQAALAATTAGAWPRPSSPTAAGLPEVLLDTGTSQVKHGVDAGDYHCEHAFFLAQRLAKNPDASVLRNTHGETLVGFLHVPEDDYTQVDNSSDRAYAQAERHHELRRVNGWRSNPRSRSPLTIADPTCRYSEHLHHPTSEGSPIMTIRLRRNTASRIDNEQIAALITQSILSPSNDDAPDAASPKPQGRWLSWSGGLSKSSPNPID